MTSHIYIGALCLAGGLMQAQTQLSSSAYRALGQQNLTHNAVNMASGKEMNNPAGVALDASAGMLHLYVADTLNNRVLAWQDARTATAGAAADLVLAQNDGTGTAPLGIGLKGLFSPNGLAVQPATGDLYVADTNANRVVRFPKPFANLTRIEPDAVVGQPDFNHIGANNGGLGAQSLRGPQGVAFDAQGNLWVADTGNNRLLRFPAGGLGAVSPAADLVIGQKDFVSAGVDSGSTTESASGLNGPAGVALDAAGDLAASDAGNNRVLIFNAPLATNPAAGTVLGQTKFTTKTLPKTPDAASMNSPQGLSFDTSGNLHVAVPGDSRILIFTAPFTNGAKATGAVGQSNFAANAPNSGSAPQAAAGTLALVTDVKVASDGSFYAADTGNNRVLGYPQGSSIAATSVFGQIDLAHNSVNQVKPGSINAPDKIVVDYSQAPFALYVSDSANHRILVWKDAAHFHTGDAPDLVIGQPDLVTAIPNVDVAGAAHPTATSLFAPRGMALDTSGNLYVADAANSRVLHYPRPVTQTGRIAADFALGQTDLVSNSSGAVSAATLHAPSGVALGPNGDVFVSDTGNNRVLEYAASPTMGAAAIRVYGQASFTVGALPTSVSAQSLTHPQGLYVDASTTLYVADAGSNRVVLFPGTQGLPQGAGAVASIVIGQTGFTADVAGLGATRLHQPLDVSLDSASNIYVADLGNNRVLAYPNLLALPSSGGSAVAAFGQSDLKTGSSNQNRNVAGADTVSGPAGIFLDRKDTLYIADSGNSRVLHVLKSLAPLNAAAPVVGNPVAPGSAVSVYGGSLAAAAAPAANLPLPMALSNRQVVVNEQLIAPLYYVGPGQVNFQLPWATVPGGARAAVRTADTGELLAGTAMLVTQTAPALFTLSQDGKGPAVAFNQDGTLNGPANPAPKGSVIQMFGTGQGPVTPVVADGAATPSSPLSNTVAAPTSDPVKCLGSSPAVCVDIGKIFGAIEFSGLVPLDSVGVWQLNVTIPANAPSGLTPVRAIVDGVPTNLITIVVK